MTHRHGLDLSCFKETNAGGQNSGVTRPHTETGREMGVAGQPIWASDWDYDVSLIQDVQALVLSADVNERTRRAEKPGDV